MSIIRLDGSREPSHDHTIIPHLIITGTRILQPPLRLVSTVQSLLLPGTVLLLLGAEINTNTIHAMSLILGIPKSFALEDVSQMAPAVVTHYLRPRHAQTRICPLSYSIRHSIPESGPTTSGIEFVICAIEGCGAGRAIVGAGFRFMFIVLAGARALGSFLAEDAELL